MKAKKKSNIRKWFNNNASPIVGDLEAAVDMSKAAELSDKQAGVESLVDALDFNNPKVRRAIFADIAKMAAEPKKRFEDAIIKPQSTKLWLRISLNTRRLVVLRPISRKTSRLLHPSYSIIPNYSTPMYISALINMSCEYGLKRNERKEKENGLDQDC